MIGPPISGCVPKTKIISIGQAPGIHEARFMKPFSYTAGKTLFKWISSIGVEEEEFRRKVNMSAVCRCFPGKAKSGDRKPDKTEIKNCSSFLEFEIRHHKPGLVIPIGKLAIDLIAGTNLSKLDDVIGNSFRQTLSGVDFEWIPLPHPSGLNVWNHSEKAKRLIKRALKLIAENETFKEAFFQN
ncbi:MAG: uracil-DNA glycosylase [Leptospira sp.]|nr:uracil-DNA glycosylase [Leptospira sp.]